MGKLFPFVVYEAAVGAPTILYRIDNIDSSEVWVAEGNTRRLLGTYDYNINYLGNALLDSHLGGVSKDTIAGFDLPASFFTEIPPSPFGNQFNSIPVTETLTNGTETSAATLSRTQFTRSRVGGALPDSDSMGTQMAIPNGDYEGGSGDGGITGNAPNGGTFNAQVRNITDTGTSVYWAHTGNIITNLITGSEFASNFTGPTRTSRLKATRNHFLSISLVTTQGANRQLNVTFDIVSIDFRFRPLGSISRSGNERYAVVEYFEAGVFKIDYYTIDNSLNAVKVTATYPSIPATSGSDPAAFWVTKQLGSGAVGDDITLAGGLSPNPAFNVDANRLVEFPGFDSDLAVYNTTGTFSLTKQVNGQPDEAVNIQGLGLEPDRVMGIADFA